MGLIYDQGDLLRVHLQPLEDDVLEVRTEEVRVVHDHYIAVLGVKAHDLIGADALAGVHKPRGCRDPLFQALYHIQGPGRAAEMDSPLISKPSLLRR